MNLLFLVPFVLLYEFALVFSRSPVDNAAAAWLRALWHGLGHVGTLAALFVLTSVYLVAVLRRAKEAPREKGLYAGMLAEGTLYGLCLGFVANLLAASLSLGRSVPLAALGATPLARLTNGLVSDVRSLGLSVGAGVFEELVFRGLLLAGLAAFLRHALGADRITSAAVALLGSAFVFSAYHHWGPLGEPYQAAVFAFRFHAGLLLGALFLTRGLGIAALAHGVYDACVLLA